MPIENLGEKYSNSDKTIITRDWASEFPMLKKYKVLDINNRVGPLITGIYLKVVRNYIYTPTFYVHNLCREFPCFTSTLRIKYQSIEPFQHNNIYKEVAENFKNNLYIPLEGDLSIDDIIEGYKKYFKNPCRATYFEYEDLVLICGWTRQASKIKYALETVHNELSSWPEDRYFKDFGGFKNWFNDLEKRAWSGEHLDEIYKSEIIKHKAEKIPERKILF